jgi:hypothetical protein
MHNEREILVAVQHGFPVRFCRYKLDPESAGVHPVDLRTKIFARQHIDRPARGTPTEDPVE